MPKPRRLRKSVPYPPLMTTPLSPARSRLATGLLYLVTPAEPQAGPLDDLLPRVLEAGVDLVQLREKEMEARPLLRYAEIVRRRTQEFGALFLVNDRVDLALAAGADGVHVGQDDLPTSEVRCQAGTDLLIGLSTHSEDQVLAGMEQEADYIAVGPVHATPTKAGRRPVGSGLVRFAAGRAPRPFYAIGGITAENLPDVIGAGARRVAVVRAITEAADPGGVARAMKRLLEAVR